MTTPVVDDTRTARSGVVTGSTCAATSTPARTAAVPPLSQATWPTPMSPAAFSLPLGAAATDTTLSVATVTRREPPAARSARVLALRPYRRPARTLHSQAPA